MNRYVLAGVLGDLRAGRGVLCITATRKEGRHMLDQVVEALEGDAALRSVRRANGDELITLAGGGWWMFRSVRESSGWRGLSADVVFVDIDHPPFELVESLRPVVAGAGGELIPR